MKYCIIDTSDRQIYNKLSEFGFKCINVISSDCVSPPICRHTDVLYKKLDNNTIVISACQKENLSILEGLGYKVIINEHLKSGYKTESYLNYIINKKYCIFNPNTAELPPEKYLNGIKKISVNQGYTGCSTITVTEDAYITDDAGIYRTLSNNRIDCLLIPKGDILLPGYNYGFIGGASVKISDREILFFGDFTDKNIKIKSCGISEQI